MIQLLSLLSMVAFVLNVGIYVLTLVDGMPVSLGTTWPVFVVSMLLALTAVGVKMADTGNEAARMARMSQDQMVEHVRSGLNQSGWTRFFGKTPTWAIIAVPLLFVLFGANLIFDGIPNGNVKNHEGEYWVFDLDERPVRKATAAEIDQSKFAEVRMASSGFALFAMVAFAIFSGHSTETSSEVTETESESLFDQPVASQVGPQRKWIKEAEGSLELDGRVVAFEFSSCRVHSEEDLAGNLDIMVRTNPPLSPETLSGNLFLALPGFDDLVASDAYGHVNGGTEISFGLGNSAIGFNDNIHEAINVTQDVKLFWGKNRENGIATVRVECATGM